MTKKANAPLEREIDNLYHRGHVMPQNLPVEEAVLGALMLDHDAFDNAVGLHRDVFYSAKHQEIFTAMSSLQSKQLPIDLLTVVEELKRMDKLRQAGGPAYISGLTNKVASAANIEYHTKIILQEYIKREAIRVGTVAIRQGLDHTSDSLQMISSLESELFRLTGRFTTKATKTGSQIASDIRQRIATTLNSEGQIVGLPTGFKQLDELLSGMQAPDYMVFAARPGMGKTALMMCIVRTLAIMRGIPVGMFSLEMSAAQLGDRLTSIEAHVPGNIIMDPRKANDAELGRINTALDRIDASPIFIDETPGITITELRSKARKMVREHGCQLIIIDYLQLMSGGKEDNANNREQEISAISRGIKAMAKELHVPVIALSQLSRAVEARGGDKRPQLSDLRESGSIEQDCDQAFFIYRPEYYKFTKDADGNSTEGLAEIITGKNRRGALETIKIEYVSHFTQFKDYVERQAWDEETLDMIEQEKNEDLPF